MICTVCLGESELRKANTAQKSGWNVFTSSTEECVGSISSCLRWRHDCKHGVFTFCFRYQRQCSRHLCCASSIERPRLRRKTPGMSPASRFWCQRGASSSVSEDIFIWQHFVVEFSNVSHSIFWVVLKVGVRMWIFYDISSIWKIQFLRLSRIVIVRCE